MSYHRTKASPDAGAAASETRKRRWLVLAGTMLLPFCVGSVLTGAGFVFTPLAKLCVVPEKSGASGVAATRPGPGKAARTGPAVKPAPARSEEDAFAQLRKIEEINQQNRQRMGLGAHSEHAAPGYGPVRPGMRQPGTPLRPDAPGPARSEPGGF